MATFITVGCVILLFASLTIWRYVKGDTPTWSSGKLSEVLARLNPFKRRISTHIWYHEGYKILIANKAIWIVLAFVLLQFYHYSTYRRPTIWTTPIFESMRSREGLTPQEARAFAQEEEARFEKIYRDIDQLMQRHASNELTEMQYTAALASFQSKLASENAFSTLMQRLEYLAHTAPMAASSMTRDTVFCIKSVCKPLISPFWRLYSWCYASVQFWLTIEREGPARLPVPHALAGQKPGSINGSMGS
ncbi:MAG: hypothetical protein ACLTXL_01020 [Clostridia bacterium]